MTRRQQIAVDLLSNDGWVIRRRVMFIMLAVLTLDLQYIIFAGADSKLNETAVIALLGSVTAIIGSYVFGAVWDDSSKRTMVAESSDAVVNEVG